MTPYLYVAPAVIFFALFVLIPMAQSVWLSFFRWDGVTPATWIGLGNYINLMHDGNVLNALSHSLILIVFYCIMPVLLALILTGLMSRAAPPGLAAFRAMLFLPQIMASVVVGVAWRAMYAQQGPVNSILHAVGLGGAARAWLGDFGWALPALGVIGTWGMIGLVLVLLLAGTQNIPADLYEAARIDGAGPVREFVSITIPSIRREIGVAVTLSVIAALRTFDIIYVTTLGGPGRATEVPALLIFRLAFREGDVGFACTIAVVLSIIIFGLTFFIVRIANNE